MTLSERVRPGVEAAPWVIEEIKKLEAENARMRSDSVDRVMNLSDERVVALCRMEGHDPEDVAAIGKQSFKIAALNVRVKELEAQLANKKVVAWLRSDAKGFDQYDMCHNEVKELWEKVKPHVVAGYDVPLVRLYPEVPDGRDTQDKRGEDQGLGTYAEYQPNPDPHSPDAAEVG